MSWEKLEINPSQYGRIWVQRYPTPMNRAHHHRELELNLVIKGRAKYILDGQIYNLEPRSMVYLFPEQEHILTQITDDFEIALAVINPKGLRQIISEENNQILLSANPGTHFCRKLPFSLVQHLTGLFQETLELDGQGDLFNVSLGLLILSAWKAFVESGNIHKGKEMHPAVLKSVTLLRDRSGMIEIDELCPLAGLSRSQLSRVFKEQTGSSLGYFRNQMKVEYYKKIRHENPRQTMLDSAMKAGFGSYAQFHRVFKDIMGISPREWED